LVDRGAVRVAVGETRRVVVLVPVGRTVGDGEELAGCSARAVAVGFTANAVALALA
jgi:hypothetical protein